MADENASVEELDERFQAASRARQTGELDDAERAFRELLLGYRAVERPDRMAMVGINLAQLLHRTGRLDAAVEQFRETLALTEAIGDERRAGLCLGGMANLRQEAGDLAGAEALITRAIDAFREQENPIELGNQLGNLGLVRQSQGDVAAALDLFTEALSCFQQSNFAPGAMTVLQSLGELHRRQAEYDDAQIAHKKAIEIATALKHPIAIAHSTRALGQIARARGDAETARRLIRDGLAGHRKVGDLRGELAALIDLGSAEFALGEAAEAVACLDECASRSRAAGMVVPLMKALLNRALYRLDTDCFEAFERDMSEAHDLLERIDDPQAWNVWSVTRARSYLRRARWDEALALLEGELERVDSYTLSAARAPILCLTAALHSTRGDVERARSLFEEAQALYRAAGDVEGARLSLLESVRLLAESGSLKEARAAIDSLESTVDAEEHLQPLLRAELYSVDASLSALEGDYQGAVTSADAGRALLAEADQELSVVGMHLVAIKALARGAREGGEALPEATRERAETALSDTHRLDCPTMHVMARLALADVLHVEGDLPAAAQQARDALDQARALPFPDGIAQALEGLARIESDPALARDAIEAYREISCIRRAERVESEWFREKL